MRIPLTFVCSPCRYDDDDADDNDDADADDGGINCITRGAYAIEMHTIILPLEFADQRNLYSITLYIFFRSHTKYYIRYRVKIFDEYAVHN